MIKFLGVSKKYKKMEVFKNLNLKFSHGIYVIQGNNGEGKTTLVNLISKIDSKYDGEIFIDNINYKDINKDNFLNTYISYAIQKNEMIDNFTTNELIELLVRNQKKNKKRNLIQKLELTKVMNTKYSKLSGGEKQKVKLLISFLKENKILILDEPFNNLDNNSIINLMKIIKEEKEKVIFIIDHSLCEYNFDYKLVKIENAKVNISDIELQKNQKIGYKKNKDTFKMKYQNIIKLNFHNFKSGYLLIIFNIILFASIIVLLYGVSQQIEKFNEYSGIEKGNMILSTTSSVNCDSKCAMSNKISFSEEDVVKINKIKEIIKVDKLYFSLNQKSSSPVIPQSNLVIDQKVNTEKVLHYSNYLESITIDELKKNLLTIPQNEINISASTMLMPKDEANKFPLSINIFNGGEILYGELPTDYSENEVMISELVASYYVNELKLNNIDELIGKSIKIPVTEANIKNDQITSINSDTKFSKFKVVGIYSTDMYKQQDIIFGYDDDSYMYKHNMPSENELNPELQKDDFDSYNDSMSELGLEQISYEEFNKLQGDGIDGIYIQYPAKYEKEMYNKIQKEYPNNVVLSHYGTTFGQIGSKIKNSIVVYALTILSVVLILILFSLLFSQQYYQLKIKEKKLFKLYGMTNRYYNFINLLELFIYSGIAFIVGIALNYFLFKVSSKLLLISLIVFIVLQIIIYIVNMFISKLIYNKYLEKRGVR